MKALSKKTLKSLDDLIQTSDHFASFLENVGYSNESRDVRKAVARAVHIAETLPEQDARLLFSNANITLLGSWQSCQKALKIPDKKLTTSFVSVTVETSIGIIDRIMENPELKTLKSKTDIKR